MMDEYNGEVTVSGGKSKELGVDPTTLVAFLFF
jgi:hypothetical protein